MGWVGGCRLVGKLSGKSALSGMKDDFVWACSAGKRTSCGVLFIVVECSELHCSDELYCTLFLRNFGYYSKCYSAISK